MFSFKEVVHLIPVFLSLFFALQLFSFKNLKTKSNIILGQLMIVITIIFILDIFYYLYFYKLVIYFRYYLIMPLVLSYVPLLYFYIKSLTTENFSITAKDIKHFMPSILILLLNIIFYGFCLTNNEKYNFVIRNNIYDFSIVNFILKMNIIIYNLSDFIYFTQLAVYLLLFIKQFKQHSKNIDQFFTYKEKISLSWIKIFIIVFIMLSVFDMLENIYFRNLHEKWEEIWELLDGIRSIFYVSFLGYFGMKQTDIYANSVIHDKTNSIIMGNILGMPDFKLSNKKKYERSCLTIEHKKLLINKLIILMEQKKIFLNPNLNIDLITAKLKTNKKYLSQAINEILGKNFYNFVNEYRINEAKKLLLENNTNKLSIEGIALTVGFNSKSSFNSAFKKFTQSTPSQFYK